MDQKEFRTKITKLYTDSVIDLIMLADQANPTDTKKLGSLKQKVTRTVNSMLIGFITEYIDSVVNQLGETGDMDFVKTVATEDKVEDDDERILH